MKRYAIHPGYELDSNDENATLHWKVLRWVSYERLIELYQLDPEECIHHEQHGMRGVFVHIYPRNDGKYPLMKGTE